MSDSKFAFRGQSYWLVENEEKKVSLCLYTMNNGDYSGETVFTFEGVLSERDPEQWDKLRKVQPKNECKFYWLFSEEKSIL